MTYKIKSKKLKEKKESYKLSPKKRREELLKKAKNNYNEVNKYGEISFDPINHLSSKEGKELMRLEYKLGYSDYDPDEEEKQEYAKKKVDDFFGATKEDTEEYFLGKDPRKHKDYKYFKGEK